jgi:hypothetical protein
MTWALAQSVRCCDSESDVLFRPTSKHPTQQSGRRHEPRAQREELMGPLGVTARLFRDPDGSNRVGMPRDPRYGRLPGADAGRSVMGSHEGRRCFASIRRRSSRRRNASSVIGATEDGADFQSMNLLANAKRESPRLGRYTVLRR